MTLIDIWLGILQGLGTTAAVTAYGLVFAIPFALAFGVAQYLTGGVARLLSPASSNSGAAPPSSSCCSFSTMRCPSSGSPCRP
ncbi:hypothetical protein [Neoaquamicrobium sediminum]|uniref:hypothetical protein n=1 Tax=Neoaquamicrobium sediminum TaxID=1849104 RepID=UPI0028ACDE83|nr:hypothetical protein [Mesorhizobium sediminum]